MTARRSAALRSLTPAEDAHTRAERVAQGLDENITDPAVLARMARVVVADVTAANRARARRRVSA